MKGSFYLDQNVSHFLVAELEQRGHLVSTTTAERRVGAPDPHQLLYAAERNWTLVTHNRKDFWMLHDAWLRWSRRWGVRPRHAGIIVIQLYADQSFSEIAENISNLLTDPDSSLDTALYDWRRSTGWVRFPG